MPTVVVKVAGGTKHKIEVPSEIQLPHFRQLVAEATLLPLPRLKLVLRGKALPLPPSDAAQEDKTCHPILKLQDGDQVVALVAPTPPPSHLLATAAAAAGGNEDDNDDDDLTFRLPANASAVERQLANFLKATLRMPDFFLVAFFSIRLRTWLFVVIWLILAPVVQHFWELGPLYIIATCFALIFINLGKRREGEMSAYSVFNANFEQLPGTLDADRLDQQIRAGHM